MFSKTDTYMQAMDNDNVITLTLTYSDTDINDFNKFSNTELAEVAHNFITESGTDVKYKNSTQDEAGKDMVWLYFETSVHDNTANTDKKQYQATTVYNGKNVTLTILRNEGDAEASDYSTLESVAKTVKFPAKEKPADNKTCQQVFIERNKSKTQKQHDCHNRQYRNCCFLHFSKNVHSGVINSYASANVFPSKLNTLSFLSNVTGLSLS